MDAEMTTPKLDPRDPRAALDMERWKVGIMSKDEMEESDAIIDEPI